MSENIALRKETNNELKKPVNNIKKAAILTIIIIGILLIIAIVVIQFTSPTYAIKIDVNPSVEIFINKLEKVVQIKPINEEAKELLKDAEFKNNDLPEIVEDIADLMVEKGYIAAGKDNYIMITVDDNTHNGKVAKKLNISMITYLQNKQIEATVINQAVPSRMDDGNNTGSELLAKRMIQLDRELNYEDLSNMSIRELIEISEARKIDLDKLFSDILNSMQ